MQVILADKYHSYVENTALDCIFVNPVSHTDTWGQNLCIKMRLNIVINLLLKLFNASLKKCVKNLE